jgi:hypothetical protein
VSIIYTVAIVAVRVNAGDGVEFDSIDVQIASGIVRAVSKAVAKEGALQEARKRWPPDQGWTNHGAALSRLSELVKQ